MISPLKQLQNLNPSHKKVRVKLRKFERVSLRHAHKFIIRRAANLRDARRSAGGWVIVVLLMSLLAYWQGGLSAQQYATQVPAEGGIYTEGVAGVFDNLNPLYAASPAERSASKLLFASLVTYDDKNDLVGELADHWSVNADGKVYTVHVRENAKWSDGEKITADDVVNTYNLIKNADTQSSYYASWRNIGIEKIDQYNVKFTLPVSYAAFTSSLTIGILPQHALKKIAPSELRTTAFNRAPTVTSGPFKFGELATTDAVKLHYVLRMSANNTYVLGVPKVDNFQLYAYKDRDDMVKAFDAQEVASYSDTALSVLSTDKNSNNKRILAPLYNGVYAFLNMESPVISDIKVRQALQMSTDRTSLSKLFEGKVNMLDGPLLPEQIGYRSDLKPAAHDLTKAGQLLDEAGWRLAPNGKRQKDGRDLIVKAVTVSGGDFSTVAGILTDEWSKLGITFETTIVKPDDIQQNYIFPRNYDILIYEIAIGRDPDVYAYWHSTQANARGLNLSNYKSVKSDDALDSARTLTDPNLRNVKYRFFVQQWMNDIPAIGLYRSTLLYTQNDSVTTITSHPLVDATDRYFNVRYWAAGLVDGRITR